jgi:hypothetical protein
MRTWVTVVALVAGCVHVPQMTAADLDAHARANMLEAQEKLAGQMLVVRGVVKETTLATRERREFAPASYSGPAAAVTREEQLPLIVLQPGSVLCYFEPANIGDVAQVRAGDAVAFECEVQSFKPMQQMTVSTLAGCRRFEK